MIPTPHLDAALAAWSHEMAPPSAPRPYHDFVADLRYPDGPRGPRSESPHGDLIEFTPLQRHMSGVLLDPQWRRITWCKPVQAGVTFLVGLWLAWVLKELRRSVLYALPTKELHEVIWRTKFREVWRQIPGLLPETGPGSDEGVPVDIRTPGGAHLLLLSTGGKSEAGQAGATIGTIVCDELDSMKPRMRKLLDRRRRMFGSAGRSISYSTIKHDRNSPVEQLYRSGLAVRPHHACIACGMWQTWEWSQIEADWSTPLTASQTIVVRCQGCGHRHSPDEHQQTLASPRMVPDGHVILDDGSVEGPAAQTDHYSIRHTCLDDLLYDLRETAVEYQEAHEALDRFGDPEPMRQFHRDYLTQGYADIEQQLGLRQQALAARSAMALLGLGEAPSWTDAPCCVAAIDVQKRGLWYQVKCGHPETKRRWIIDEGWHPICGDLVEPTDAQRHAGFDFVRTHVMSGYHRPDGQIVRPQLGFIDTADGTYAPQSYEWMQQHPGWYGIRGQADRPKGADAAGAAIYRLPGVLTVFEQKQSLPHRIQLELMVDQLKAQVVRSLQRPTEEEGSAMIPRGFAPDSPFVRQLCAEELRMTAKGPKWHATYRHNHQLDLAVYTDAALEWLYQRMADAGAAPAPSAGQSSGVVGTALG